jgi:cold shock CspA family protein
MQNDNVNTDEKDEVVVEEERVVVEEENNTLEVGQYVGQCKWFNDLLGYGFVTVCDGNEKGKDIFVHHSGIMPLNSNYRTLKKGEYLNFDIINGMNGLQAVHVTGIQGGPLMCDFVSSVKPTQHSSNTEATPRPRYMNNNSSSQTQSTQSSQSSQSSQSTQVRNGKGAQLGTQWYVVTKTGRKKNLAKYSKEGRTLMKQAKQETS